MTADRHSDDLFLRLAEGRELTDADRHHADGCPGCQAGIARAGRFGSDVEHWARSVAVEPMPAGIVPDEAPASSRWRPVAAVGLALAAVVAAVVILPPLLPQIAVGPSSGPSTSTLAMSTPLPSGDLGFPTAWPGATGCVEADLTLDPPGAAPDALAHGTEITWRFERIPEARGGWLRNPLAGTFWGDRAVVIGSESPRVGGDSRSLLLVRGAGGSWTQGAIAAPNLELSRVAVTDEEALVMGTDYSSPLPDPDVVIYRSRDGVNWEQTFSAPGYALSIQRTPAGWLALAMDPTGDSNWALTSPDGVTWTAAELYAGELYAGLAEVGWGTEGWFAVGGIDEGDRTHAALWRSADGMTWSCEILAMAERDRLAKASFALHGPSGLIAVGQDNVRCPDLALCIAGPSLLWQALDDGRWYGVQGDAAQPPIGNSAIAGDHTSGLWVVGAQGAWHWDGRRWSPVPASAQSDALDADWLLPAGLTVDSGRLLVVGQTMRPDGNPEEGVVVIGEVAP